LGAGFVFDLPDTVSGALDGFSITAEKPPEGGRAT
jgi:hypothetical protein